MTDELRIVTSVANEAEAELVCERLLSEGIQAIARRTIGSVEWGSSGARDVYVSEADLDRARAVIAEAPFSEEELARFSEEARPKGEEE
jgi:Putative prokaryotic signal transducing protein